MRISSVTILLAACATTTASTPKGGPRGLRASEHLDVAAQHDELAHQSSIWPDTRSMGPDHVNQAASMPWYRTWNATGEHERLAAIHRGKAAELNAEYAAACGDRSSAEVAISPLARYGIGGWPTQSGAILYLSSTAGPPDRLLEAIKCHRAFMMLAPSGMDDCPLDLPGLVLDARGDADGITVSLSVEDRAQIPELQRRAAHELEVHQHRESETSPHKENGSVEYHP